MNEQPNGSHPFKDDSTREAVARGMGALNEARAEVIARVDLTPSEKDARIAGIQIAERTYCFAFGLRA